MITPGGSPPGTYSRDAIERSPYLDTCDDCGTCLSCGRPWCPNETPSPGEGDGLCVSCWLGLDGGEG